MKGHCIDLPDKTASQPKVNWEGLQVMGPAYEPKTSRAKYPHYLKHLRLSEGSQWKGVLVLAVLGQYPAFWWKQR
jgi:hypothetical protein